MIKYVDNLQVDEMKKIAIIIPCYNVETYIDRCLNSIVNQTMGVENLQVICVDDASTDGTWQRLQAWEQQYPEDIMLIQCEKNGRQGTARNIALQYVQTDFVGFVDSDDWIEADMYEKMYEKMVQYDCDIVFCRNFRSSEYTSGGEIKRCNSEDCIYSIISEEERKAFIVNNIIGYVCGKRLF